MFYGGFFMKETGMTRRVDELGRVVIPKEIRQILKIRTGTPLEIFVEGDRLVLRKYAVAQGYAAALRALTDCLYNATGLTVAVFDTEQTVFCRGRHCGALEGKRLSDAVYPRLEGNRPFFCASADLTDLDGKYAYVFPLADKGDLLGAAAVVSDEDITLTDAKLARLACEMFLQQLD